MLAWILAAVVTSVPPPDLTVVGTIVSPRPDQSLAILRSEGRTRTVAAGETAFGGRIVSVGPGLVTLAFGAERVEVRLAGMRELPAAPPPAVAETAPEAAVSMARADVERRLGSEIPKILAETTVVPYLDGGQVAGLLVSRLPEGLLSEVGLRPGDVLQSVNDVPVDSMATLASLWPRFQNVSEVRAVVLRDGRPFSLTLALR